MASMTTIHHNGSRWAGEAPATVEELLNVLATEALDRRFEAYGNFIVNSALHQGTVSFFGNFYALSHGFSIETDDAQTIRALTASIRENQKTPAYLAQPKPEPRSK